MKWLARAKALVGTLLAPAEDPRLAQRPMLKKVNHALGVVANTKKTLETKITEVQKRASDLDKRAREALINGQEDEARAILHRWQISMSEYQSLEEQLQHVHQEQHQLTLVKERLTYQIEANLIDEAQKGIGTRVG